MQALARRLATDPSRPWPDRPVRVALVITDLDVGGAERALVALATGLDRRRWEPSVIALGPEGYGFSHLAGFIAVTIASINIFGGFIVTQRMLAMFQKKATSTKEK